MNERLKKIIIIIVFVLVVIGLAYAIYYLFFKPIAPEAPEVVEPVIEPGQLPEVSLGNINQFITNVNEGLPSISRIPEEAQVAEVANGGYTKVNSLTQTKLISPQLNKSGSFNYYDEEDGRFYRFNPVDASISRLSDQRFFAVDNITWSDDSAKAVLEYPDGSNIIYDFNENKQYTLPKEFQDFDFATNGNSLAAEVIGTREETNWIVTANVDGSNIQFVERVGDQSDNVDINLSPNNQVVALFRKNISADNQEILFIGRNRENFKSLITNGRGFEGEWTPNGSRLLYSVYSADNGFRPTLWIAEASGDRIGLNNTNLGLNTWIDKCTMTSDSTKAYCSVPDELPNGSGLYRGLAAGTFDSFYQIDLTTGQVSLLAQPVGNQIGYSVQRLFLSADESVLYFQDSYTGYLQSVNLK